MTTVVKRGRRGCTVFGHDPGGAIRTRHIPGMVDILARGSQTVIPPTPHPDGMFYQWTTDATLLGTPIANLPIIVPDIADRLTTALAPWIDRTPFPVPARSPLQGCELSERERERQHRYAEAILARELPALANMAKDSGRNRAAFCLVCRIGRWAHHGIIPYDRLTADVLAACERNGLVDDDGRKAVLATIGSGLTKSAGDALPNLGARHG